LLTQEGYNHQFAGKLGFVPFPATLNVLLEETFPAEVTEIEIESFTEDDRTFGACRCRRILLSGIAAAAIRPERSLYPPKLIEVIAPE
jgi:riboflavin kinase